MHVKLEINSSPVTCKHYLLMDAYGYTCDIGYNVTLHYIVLLYLDDSLTSGNFVKSLKCLSLEHR